MLIIYNPEKNLFVLTILTFAMLINIGVLGVRRKRARAFKRERGVFDFRGENCTCVKMKKEGGVFEIARRAKRYYQNMDNSLKPKRSKKEKKGYIYIYSIYYFFFFF